MPEESVEAPPSADNGNIPLDVPSESPEPVVPPVEEPAPPAAPELFELPDGRKVDAETLSREWKTNFMPDYTKKSQELAAVKAPINNQPVESPYASPEYVPKSYEELLQIAETRALTKFEEREQATLAARTEAENAVSAQIKTLKDADPSLDENALFVHANKYQFRDLKVAYDNMKAMSTIAKTVQQNTVKNIAKHADPVSIVPGATGAKPDPAQFATAKDFLRSLKN